MGLDFQLKFLIKDKQQAEFLIRQTEQKDHMKSILDSLKKLPKASIFLNKVSKKEAPDYFNVIKNPMDLGTMTRKLHLYRSFDDFSEDINLIYNNCVTFNTAEYYIDCANVFKIEADALIAKHKSLIPQFDDSSKIKDIWTMCSNNQDMRNTITQYFKAVGFEKFDKGTIDVMLDVTENILKKEIKKIQQFRTR